MKNLKMDRSNRVVIYIVGSKSTYAGASSKNYSKVYGTKKPYVQALKQKIYLEDLEQCEDYDSGLYIMSSFKIVLE